MEPYAIGIQRGHHVPHVQSTTIDARIKPRKRRSLFQKRTVTNQNASFSKSSRRNIHVADVIRSDGDVGARKDQHTHVTHVLGKRETVTAIPLEPTKFHSEHKGPGLEESRVSKAFLS